MKILFSDFTLPYLLKDSEYPVGGWAVELNTWIKGIIRVRQRVGVLSWKGSYHYIGKKLDFDLLDTYDPHKGIKILKYFYLYIPAMLRAAKQYNPDIIIQACSGLETGIMAFVAARLKIPFIYRVANDMDVDGRYKTRLRKYEQIAYCYGLRKACIILCQNQYQHDQLKKQFPKKPMSVLHNPFDTYRPLPMAVKRDDKNYIAWLGVFSSQKNMSLLLKVANDAPTIAFHIAGMPSRKMDKETEKAVNQLKQLSNVNFIGYVKRKAVLDFLAGSVALLSTSHYEGFSNTFLESLISGTPVIAPLRVDPDHIITNNNLGLTTPSDLELPKLINKIWKMNHEDYEHLCENCRKYVLAFHEPAVKAQELIDILQPLVRETSRCG